MYCSPMTLWSREKTYLRQNDVGAAWIPGACKTAAASLIASPSLAVGLVLGRGLREPFLEFLRRVHGQVALHPVMGQAAQLRACDLPVTRAARLHPHARGHAGNGVLLDPKLRQEEGMDHVLGVERDDRRLIDREMELIQSHDVVGRVELSVGPRVADVPGELLGRDVDHGSLPGEVIANVGP